MQSFRYELTYKELCYLLFSKKKCPKCSNKMKRIKNFEIVDGSKFNTTSTPLYIQGRKVKNYNYMFNCSYCNSKYKLQELVKNNK